MVALLTHEERPFNLVADELINQIKRLSIDEHHPDFIAFSFHPDCLLFKIDILDVN